MRSRKPWEWVVRHNEMPESAEIALPMQTQCIYAGKTTVGRTCLRQAVGIDETRNTALPVYRGGIPSAKWRAKPTIYLRAQNQRELLPVHRL